MIEREKQEFRVAVSTKLQPDQFQLLNKICELNHKDKSVFIREAILEKLNSGRISNVAGTNFFDYNLERDSFVWKIKLDDGSERIVLESIPLEFMQNLYELIGNQLKNREELLGKKKKTSVAIPRGLVK